VKLVSWVDIPPATPILTLSRPTFVGIPPDLKKSNLSFAKQTFISIAPANSPIELSKPTPQAPQEKAFTLEDFMGCVDKANDDERRRNRAREHEREEDLLNFRRLLDLPP
jgi:hypothetical protein